jgi:hypothetical protein
MAKLPKIRCGWCGMPMGQYAYAIVVVEIHFGPQKLSLFLNVHVSLTANY